MNKQVLRYKDVKDKILHAVDTIADPIRETISPKGRNVIFESKQGEYISTNDGVTIAKNITVKDPVENAIISIIKHSALKTNTEVGDGTSTTILLSQILIKEGLKLIDNGWNQMDVKRYFESVGKKILDVLKSKAIPVQTDEELRNVAKVSANYDEEIAKNVVKIARAAGEFGMVFLDENNKPETEVEENLGFQIESGLFAPELRNTPGGFAANYKNVPVLITDKRIYYPEEAETILKTVLLAGHKSVVIVARDFIGQSVNTFITNHTKGVCQILLVKDPQVTEKDNDTLQDLAVYLGGTIISEKTGSLVDNLEFGNFAMAERVFADGVKTIIGGGQKKNRALDERIAALKSELAKDKENESVKKRIASLTSGMVTVKVGGSTKVEVLERLYRYEDAIHAARAALKDGYLIGGGVTLMSIFPTLLPGNGEIEAVFKKFCEGNTRQVAANHGGVHIDALITDILNKNIDGRGRKYWKYGFNAVTGEIEDMEKAGIIDPYKVTDMAVRNSLSVAAQIISSNFLIVNEPEEDKNK